MTVAYADVSALAKLAINEPESAALARAIEQVDTLLTSIVGRIELERAIRRAGIDDAQHLVEQVMSGVDVLPLHVATAGLAAATPPPALRTLDAIHLASMRSLEADIDIAFVYDARLATAAGEYGLRVLAPR